MFLAYLRRSVAPHSLAVSSTTSMDVERHSQVSQRSRTWLLMGLFALSTVACAKQGEGGRCDLLSGNDDCESGLRCVSLADRNQGVGAVCCPSEGDSENPICKGNSVDLTGEPSDSDAQVSAVDAGDASTINPDAAADASTVEAGADATVIDSSVATSSVTSSEATESSSSDSNSSAVSTGESTVDTSSATDTVTSGTDTLSSDTGTSASSSEAVDAGDAG